MKSLRLLSAALLAFSLAATGQLWSMPQSSGPTDNSVINVAVQDCHSDVRRHYLSDYGRKVWHRHRQSNCRVVLSDPNEDDDVRDCHRDVKLHYLRDYGRKVWHKHVGNRCRVKTYEYYDGGGSRPGGTCIQLGPLVYCEN